MSSQEVLNDVVFEKMSEEEVREALMDIVLLLTDNNRTAYENQKLLMEIYKERLAIPYDIEITEVESPSDDREALLMNLYDFTIVKNHTSAQISKDPSDAEEYRKTLSIVDYLREKGYIEVVGQTLGYVIIKLTAHGIDYVESKQV